ncbi:MAG: hypothetical protein ACTSYG_02645 [Candidatus Heimdallarchaeota archaeon]
MNCCSLVPKSDAAACTITPIDEKIIHADGFQRQLQLILSTRTWRSIFRVTLCGEIGSRDIKSGCCRADIS